MTKNRLLTLLLGLVAIFLGYSIVGNSVARHVASTNKSCGTYQQATNAMHKKTTKRKTVLQGAQESKKETKRTMPFSNEQTALFENDNQQRPDWYTYLLANGYTQTYWDDYDHEEDHVLTRKEISPYLLRYAQIHNLDSYKEDPCTFDDIADESTNTQLVITEVCKLRLLRGRNGSFLKDTLMTQTDMLVLLMRSKFGYLNEDTNPWFKNYYDKAVQQGIVKPGLDYSIFEEGVTLRDFSLRMQRIETTDASTLLAQ